MDYIQVYWTCATIEEARLIAKELLRRKLVACANIIPKLESIYVWEGQEQHEEEVQVCFKTQRGCFDKIQEYILIHGRYTVPAIIQVPIEKGYSPYLEWISSNTNV